MAIPWVDLPKIFEKTIGGMLDVGVAVVVVIIAVIVVVGIVGVVSWPPQKISGGS